MCVKRKRCTAQHVLRQSMNVRLGVRIHCLPWLNARFHERLSPKMHDSVRHAVLLALFLLLGLLLLAVLHDPSLARQTAWLPSKQPVHKQTTTKHLRSSIELVLEPWLKNVSKAATMPKCYHILAATWGIGTSFNNVILGATIIKQLKPGTDIYYDHAPSYYQCSDNKTVDAFLSSAGKFIKTGAPPEDCHVMDFPSLVSLVQQVVAKWSSGLIWESWSNVEIPDHPTPQQRLDRSMLLSAAFQALCPVVNDWWNLAPELQAEVDKFKQQLRGKAPVIAIHARGGDKASELGKYVDNKTHQYPMQNGMQRLIKLQPALKKASPICVIVGDDYAYAQTVQQWAVSTLGCATIVMRTPTAAGAAYNWAEFINLPMEQRCARTKEYLVDIELMAWATYLVGNHRANGDTLAMYLRKCKYHRDYDTAVPGTGSAFFPLW